MISALLRKTRQVTTDPTLRHWLWQRALGRTPGPAPFQPHQPPYLAAADLVLKGNGRLLPEQSWPAAKGALTLPLPGVTLTLEPGGATEQLFVAWPDLETQLAVHRFAWLPLLGPDVDPAWVATLWHDWQQRFGTPDQSWAWHPYTAAERAINLLTFSKRAGGLPPGAAALLPAHAHAIAAKLEYFGDHYTGNHLSNNGRGLYLLGLALDWPVCRELGWRILSHEAPRLFTPAGMLNEQSSHYHLLVTRNYLSCWLAARQHQRPETEILGTIASKALAVAAILSLPGGLPLVGDISPDCPPEFLAGLLCPEALNQGWGAWLNHDERQAVAHLRERLEPANREALADDGWIRGQWAEWSGLWHASPLGWAAIPGHGHQDMGSAELHWRGVPIFIDPGRGAYGENGDAALYRSAATHGLLQVDDADPFPPNRPYFHPDFRRQIAGAPPILRSDSQSVTLSHGGFKSQGVSRAQRQWRFEDHSLIINDSLDGHGRHRISRRLICPWPITQSGSQQAIVTTNRGEFLLEADVPLELAPVTRWTAYGRGEKAWAVTAVADRIPLPWRGRLRISPR